MASKAKTYLNAWRYGSAPKLPDCQFVPKKYKGPSLQRTNEIKESHMPPAVYNMYKKPVLLHQGHMQWLFDDQGRRYLDLIGGIATVSIGHCHPKVTAAVREQMDSVWHTTNLYRHPKIYEYVEKLASKFPGDLKVVYLVNSGTEANELALILAKAYTGNQDIISLQHGYHGCCGSSVGLTASGLFRFPTSSTSKFHHTMLPDPYRGIWGGCRDSLSPVAGGCKCSGECVGTDKYIEQLQLLIQTSVPVGGVAAFFAESIQGVNGAVQFTKGYLKKAKEVIKAHGGVFVADEVQTGFGRTGDTFWGFESQDVIPDIVTMAKGIGNGFPLAAVVTTKEIAAAHTRAIYFNTFGGNPLASTAGKAVLEAIEEENLQEKNKILGKYFIEQLMQLQKEHAIIGDVRGKGLMLGVELVNPGTTDPISRDDAWDITEAIKDNGILLWLCGKSSNVITVKPPMCINKEDIDYTIAVLDEVFRQYSSQMKS